MNINLLQRFYKGECSEDEVQEVLNWFTSGEQKGALLEQLETDWTRFDDAEEEVQTAYDSEKVLQKIHARIRKDAFEADKVHKTRLINISRLQYLRVASIIILAILSSLIIRMFVVDSQQEIGAGLVVEAPAGQKRILMLEDGTKVVLNAGSRLFHPEKFLDDKREVVLEGEAFFEVAEDAGRPFTVTSDELLTTVLGTSFNIRAYQDEENIQVAVASGKVKVHYRQDDRYLVPGRLVNYDAGDKTLTVMDFEEEAVLSWKDGVLYFKDATFGEVIRTLERWYGIEIEASGKGTQDWQYTGIFRRQDLENVLISIGYVKHFDYTIKGKRVELTFRNS